jgi:hypothetical protein
VTAIHYVSTSDKVMIKINVMLQTFMCSADFNLHFSLNFYYDILHIFGSKGLDIFSTVS